MTTKVNITDLEEDVLKNGLYGSCFNDITIETLKKYGGEYGCKGNSISVWSDCVIDDCEKVESKQLSGVLSSLVKKDLVVCEGETVTVTKEGWEVLVSLLSPPEEDYEAYQERMDEEEAMDSCDMSAPGKKLEELREETEDLKDELCQMEEEMNKPNPERDAFYRGYEEGYNTCDSEKKTMREAVLTLLKKKGLIPEFSDSIGDLEMLPDKEYVNPEEI